MRETTIADISKIAKDCLIKRGKHIPQFFGIDGEGKVSLILTPFKNDDEKEKIRDMISAFVKNKNIVKYFFVTEAWLTKIDKGTKIFRRASLDKDRIEVLQILEFNKDLRTNELTIEFSKKNGKITLGKERLVENTQTIDSSSLFNVYLEKEGHYERMKKIQSQVNEEFIRRMSKELSHKFKDEFYNAKTEEEQIKVLNKIIKEGHKEIKKQEETIIKGD